MLICFLERCQQRDLRTLAPMVLHTPCFMQSELMHEIGRVAILPMDRCELTPASFQVEVRGSLANVGPRLAWHSMWWLI